MIKVGWPLPAILALAIIAGAEEAPEIELMTLANPISDPVASGNRRGRLGPDGVLDSLPGIFLIRHPGSPIRYGWDPVECRLMFCQRNAELIQVAEGPGPAAPTVGAFGPPKFFGYRITEGGVPEFLYIHGRLGIEEQIHPENDGKTLVQRFRIENAGYGLILAIPSRWKDRIKSSAGIWSGDVLKISENEAKAGFTLTYDLSDPPDLPEIPKSWKSPATHDTRLGPPPPALEDPPETRIEAAPGLIVQRIPIPNDQAVGGIGLFGDDGLVVATRSGAILVSSDRTDEADQKWATFLDHPLPDLQILDAGEMPTSLLVSHAYGTARLFDTDGNGKADFFKEIAARSGEAPDSHPLMTLPRFDVFEVSLKSSGTSPAAGLYLSALGLNPESPNSTPPGGPAVWIPRSICASPSPPLILETNQAIGSLANRIVVADRSSADGWRLARVILDGIGETLQGAVTDFPLASQSAGRLESLVASRDGETLWAAPENGAFLAKITRDTTAPAFEVRSVHLAPDAFEFAFSKPIDRTIAVDLSLFRIRSIDPLTRGSKLSHKVEAAIVDSDGMTLALRVGGIAPGRLMEFDLEQIRAESGDALSHGPIFYTINALPEFPIPESVQVQPGNSTADSEEESPVLPSRSGESLRESKDASKSL